jgi:pyruvate dehydrogenase E1 component beta subunit
MALRNLVQALNLALRQEMEKDDRIVLLGEDIGRQGGVFRVTEGLLDRFGPMRVLDTPVSEAGIVGTSIGLALAGLRPVAEIQFSGFMFNALHQLGLLAARFRSRSRGTFQVPMVVRSPWGGGVRALELHNESEEAVYAQLPGLKVVIPSRPRRARALLVASIRDPDPVVFLEPKRVYRSIREEVPDEEEIFPIGEADIVRSGRHLTLITYGSMLQDCLQAAEQAERLHQISVEVIDLLTVVPMDTATIVQSVQKNRSLRRCPRGAAFLRYRCGNYRADQRTMPVPFAGTGGTGDRLRCSLSVLCPRTKLSAQRGTDSRRHSPDAGVVTSANPFGHG